MKKPSSKLLRKKTADNIHDEFVRAVFAHLEIFIEFLKLYIGRSRAGRKLLQQLDLKRIKLETTHFFSDEGRERIADLIFSIPLKRGIGSTGVVFVFEHKSERKRSLAFQLLKYLVAVWNKFFSEAKNPESKTFVLPAPLLIVLHNGSKPLIDKPTLEKYIAKIAGTRRFIPKFDYVLVDLPALSIEKLGKAPLLRVILELLKRATDGTLYDVHKQILEPLALIRDDEKTRYWIQRILRYMDKALQRAEKELTPDLVDQVIQPVYRERSREMSLTFLEKLEARGEARGEAKGKAEAVIRILTRRLKAPSKALQKKINSITDINKLDELTDFALTCISLDEFATALD
jgi:hypothetical protein